MRPNRRTSIAGLLTGIALVALIFQAASVLKGDVLVFPRVGPILRALVQLAGSARTAVLIATTLKHLVLALALASVVGIALGLLQGLVPFFESLLAPLLSLLRATPMIVLCVVLMVLLKYDRVPQTATTLLLIPLIAQAACEGVRRIDKTLLDVYRLNASLGPHVVWNVHLPLIAGYLKQAYVSAVGMGLKLTVTTEYLVQTRDSLGKAIFTASYFSEYEQIYAYALLMILLVLLLGELPMALLRRVQTRLDKMPKD